MEQVNRVNNEKFKLISFIISWLTNWNWTCKSARILHEVEAKLLSFLKTPYKVFPVDIGPVVGKADKIWTLSLNTECKDKIPLVMIHGLGAGVGLWILNLDSLSSERPVYAMDSLGFGRSSRPTFSTDPMTCEKQFVKSIEAWRKAMNISQMILLGHSMGGFLASSYALSHPERVIHLILADPWGFQEKPCYAKLTQILPLWKRVIEYIFRSFSPLMALRAVGPLGEILLRLFRPDLACKYSMLTEQEKSILIPRYVHQCNAPTPSGETAFHTMLDLFAWAKYPMVNRLIELDRNIPVTFIYGSDSWLDSSPGKEFQAVRAESNVTFSLVPKAGHLVYADEADIFNKLVNEASSIADLEMDRRRS